MTRIAPPTMREIHQHHAAGDDELETHGDHERHLRADYRFASIDEALRIMGFCFGNPMSETVRRRRTTIVPELTGLWHRRHDRTSPDA